MAVGGKRPGAGRPKGAKSKHTREREEAMQRASAVIAEVIPNAFDGDAHALLMAVYRDPAQDWPLRVQAASKAIGYEKPALSTVEARVTQKFEGLTRDQLLEEIRVRAQRVGLSGDTPTAH